MSFGFMRQTPFSGNRRNGYRKPCAKAFRVENNWVFSHALCRKPDKRQDLVGGDDGQKL